MFETKKKNQSKSLRRHDNEKRIKKSIIYYINSVKMCVLILPKKFELDFYIEQSDSFTKM